MKIFKLIIFTIFLIFTFQLISFAHGGKTDSAGGHYNNSTGEYHYHHGYPAHQHTDGVCPYDFKNNGTPNNKMLFKTKTAPNGTAEINIHNATRLKLF